MPVEPHSNQQKRPSIDEYFMNIAVVVATRSTCDRLRAGAVLVRDKIILSTGYNGSPRSMDHCDDVGHLYEDGHCVHTAHGEQNAIIQAAYHGIPTKGATMYTTFSPCKICSKIIVNAGIVRVIANEVYRDNTVHQFFKDAGIRFEALNHKVVKGKKEGA